MVSAKPKQENLNELKQELDIDFHKIPISDLYQRLGTNADTGLTNAQVKHNQVKAETQNNPPHHFILFAKAAVALQCIIHDG